MIRIQRHQGQPVSRQAVEIVERKGLGHPDSICDALSEAVSVALCRLYRREVGDILHHNIDKALLAAGRVEKTFGRGRVIHPMTLIIGDRATFTAGSRTLPVWSVATETAQKWLRENLRFVDPDRHIRFQSALGQGSSELTDIFSRPGTLREANDTSAAVGFCPLSPTEEAVLGLERFLNSAAFKRDFPETGEDVKVMGLRYGNRLEFTVAMPLICGQIESLGHYFRRKRRIEAAVKEKIHELTARRFGGARLFFNSLDRGDRGDAGVYLSLLGTSAEDADSGQVGRGNRVNGLISLNRPMGAEAAAGKNPASHVGKIYNQLAHHMARQIHASIAGVSEVSVLMLSRIGRPVDQPAMTSVSLRLERGRRLTDIKKSVAAVVSDQLHNLDAFCKDLALGKYPVC